MVTEAPWPLEAFLEQCGFAVLIGDLKGRFAYTNGAARAFFGYDDAGLKARTFGELTHPDDREASLALVRETLQGRRAGFTQEKRYLTREGVRWGRAQFSLLRGADGTPTHSLCVIEDITADREAVRRLHAIVENSTDAIYVKDRDGRYVLINAAGAALVGRTPEHFLGKRDDECFLPDNAAVVMAEDRHVLATNAAHQMDESLHHPQRGKVYFSTTKYPYRDDAGAAQGVIGISRDITARRQLEQELAEQNARLKELDRLKSAIVSAVSHEFRTPLTLIKGYAEFVAEGAAGPTTPAQGDMLGKVGLAVDRLERLVSDLLDLSTMEAGVFKLAPGPADLVEVVRDASLNLAPLAQEAHVGLELALPEAGVELMLDTMRIEQVLTNLVANAIKFSPNGGTIHVTLRQEPGRAVVEVRDQGIGIPPEQQPRLFERFSRLDNGLRRSGTGLGLSIAKALVEAHGGTIGFTSQPGTGSTFWFALPLGG